MENEAPPKGDWVNGEAPVKRDCSSCKHFVPDPMYADPKRFASDKYRYAKCVAMLLTWGTPLYCSTARGSSSEMLCGLNLKLFKSKPREVKDVGSYDFDNDPPPLMQWA